jgi:hypothetical protein
MVGFARLVARPAFGELRGYAGACFGDEARPRRPAAARACTRARADGAGRHVRRVNLIERQRDHRESEAVSLARARQRPVPTCSSLPP